MYIYFNTTKVLFKPAVERESVRRVQGFQYYKSTLQTRVHDACQKKEMKNFNTTKVLFKPEKPKFLMLLDYAFQYYKSTLQTNDAEVQGRDIQRFQYYKSTLQTGRLVSCRPAPERNFNTTKVLFKREREVA